MTKKEIQPMTRKQAQRIVNRMNNGTASEAMMKRLEESFEVEYKRNPEEDNKLMYMIVAEYSYTF